MEGIVVLMDDITEPESKIVLLNFVENIIVKMKCYSFFIFNIYYLITFITTKKYQNRKLEAIRVTHI